MKKKVEFYDCLKKFLFLDKKIKNIYKVWRSRNTNKIIKVSVNWKFRWYVKFGKLERNLHIETQNQNDEINLFTDY